VQKQTAKRNNARTTKTNISKNKKKIKSPAERNKTAKGKKTKHKSRERVIIQFGGHWAPQIIPNIPRSEGTQN